MPARPKDISTPNTTFEKVLKGLNTAQQAAVRQTEGPVLVLAGPGTGKTHILASRIGYILQETDTLPSGILCLTFTDAGVTAMRRRLTGIIGSAAHKVHIFTFHSFCNKVIQENLELFGKPELEPVSELQRVEIIRQILNGLPFQNPLRKGKSDPYFYERHLAGLFGQMKSQDWTPNHISQAIDIYLQELPFRENFIYQRKSGLAQKGDLKVSKIEQEKEKMHKLRAASELYDAYLREMERLQVYDFDDMILWVLRAFETNEFLLRQYQEQYLYFLVDEYQDTNSAQNHILLQLIRYWDNPNVFIVGDDDQSIYEFQGARLRNLTDFYDAYREDLLLVLLQENYRSSQAILDSAHAVISHNEKRIVSLIREKGLTKHLRASNPKVAKSAIRPIFNTYDSRLQEEADIAEQIVRLRDAGVPLNEVAIITARHQQVENIVRLFEKKAIPYNANRRINILDLPVMRQLLLLLEYIAAEHRYPFSAEESLFKLLYFHFFKISPADIALLSFYLSAQHTKIHWRQAIGDAELLQASGIRNAAAFLRVSECLESLVGDVANLPLPILIEHAINHSGWLRYLYDQPDRTLQLEVAGTMMEFIQAETRRHPGITLRDLLKTLEQMQDNKIRIAVQQQISSAEGVQILTAHASKGLEFRYVFIPDCTSDAWEPSAKAGSYRFSLPDTLTYSGEEDAMEARRRLFYVAVTRAKEYLFMSCSRENHQGKPMELSVFADEIIASGMVSSVTATVSPKLASEALHQLMLSAAPPAIQPVETDRVAALLEHFTMTVSALQRYLDCPLSFYFQHILQMPHIYSESMVYGAAVHYALRRIFEKMQQDRQKKFPDKDTLLHFFEAEMERHKGQIHREAFQRKMEYGKHHLPLYYDDQIDHWPRDVQIELEIRHVEFRGVPMAGIIDRIDAAGSGQVRIVDYKTGLPDDKKTKGPSPAQPFGTHYWRQLIFYKILYEQFRPQQVVVGGEIAYLDPDKNDRFTRTTLDFSPDAVAFVGNLITDTYRKIMAQEFYEGCGKPDCTWCNFVRFQTNLSDDRNQAAEELDDLE